MHKPKMILFDYGGTLLNDGDADFLRGEEAAFRHVAANPRGVTPQEAARLGTELFLAARPCRHAGWELHEHQQLRLKYDLLGLRFDLPMAELEDLIWTAACPGAVMPGVPEMLAGLRARGIRTGVISNLGFTGEALTRRFARLIPEHTFEFVVASSDYGVRKPDPLIFRAALSRAGLPAEDCWYCGNELRADVLGALGAGLLPVYYAPPGTETADVPALCIRHWRELLPLLNSLG